MPALNFTTLGEIPLFRNLTPAQLAHLGEMLRSRRKSVGLTLTIRMGGPLSAVRCPPSVAFVCDRDAA